MHPTIPQLSAPIEATLRHISSDSSPTVLHPKAAAAAWAAFAKVVLTKESEARQVAIHWLHQVSQSVSRVPIICNLSGLECCTKELVSHRTAASWRSRRWRHDQRSTCSFAIVQTRRELGMSYKLQEDCKDGHWE